MILISSTDIKVIYTDLKKPLIIFGKLGEKHQLEKLEGSEFALCLLFLIIGFNTIGSDLLRIIFWYFSMSSAVSSSRELDWIYTFERLHPIYIYRYIIY